MDCISGLGKDPARLKYTSMMREGAAPCDEVRFTLKHDLRKLYHACFGYELVLPEPEIWLLPIVFLMTVGPFNDISPGRVFSDSPE
jgi:hypothetical protein